MIGFSYFIFNDCKYSIFLFFLHSTYFFEIQEHWKKFLPFFPYFFCFCDNAFLYKEYWYDPFVG